MIRRAPIAEVRKLFPRDEPQPEPAKKKPRRPSAGGGSLKRAIDDVRDRFLIAKQTSKSVCWDGATPATLVGLFAAMHNDVYRIDITDELAPDWAPAVSSARRLLEKNLAGNVNEAVNVIRWSWSREKRRVDSGEELDWRMGWRYQFSLKLLNNYRLARHR